MGLGLGSGLGLGLGFGLGFAPGLGPVDAVGDAGVEPARNPHAAELQRLVQAFHLVVDLVRARARARSRARARAKVGIQVRLA